MLSFDIKRKINTLRDILVGKVPDPKAQVEQITIALIYKFMDDMDLAGAEFGGKRVFFAGDYEKYAFTQIMLPEHSSQDRLNLYAEGIEKMVNNAELPQLFRDILRGAYIPYRDPETLNRFLKEIAEFNYDHSEDLGDSFEYLLSIMGSQGDAGQFRTPRHIIDMMVEIIAPRKNETILDPACGTAGFLISAYKYIEKQNRDEEGKSTLSGEDRKRMADNFAGYDISPDMVRLSRVNMYLHGFSNPQISEYDTLTSLDKWDDTYDVILANPPFMTPKGGISPHNRYRVSAKRAEVLFVDYIVEHLNPTGRAAIVVPEGIVFQSQAAYKQLRRYLVEENLLYAVISLPAGVFNPYSGVKTSILLIDKSIAKDRDSILFVKLNNDGYDLGAQRREIKGSEIPNVISALKSYQSNNDTNNFTDAIIVKKADIEQQDYVLVGDRYIKVSALDSSWPKVKIGDVCKEIRSGFPCGNSRKDNTGIPHIRPMNITPDGYFTLSGTKYIDKSDHLPEYNICAGDVLFNNTNSKELVGKTCFVDRDLNAGYSNHITRIRVGTQILPQYLSYVLQYMYESGVFLCRCNKWVGQAAINVKVLANQLIPLPPIKVQEEIIGDIDRYQKIILGSQQVLKNYTPTINIDPSWKVVKLKDISRTITKGTTPTTNGFSFQENGISFIKIESISENGIIDSEKVAHISAECHQSLRRSQLEENDILFSIAGTKMGISAIVPSSILPANTNQALSIIRVSHGVEPLFVLFYLRSNAIQNEIEKLKTGVAQFNLSLKQVGDLNIPIPPIAIQRRIIGEIQHEMAIVEQNNQLIAIMQKKIKNRIAEVWGEKS